MRNHWIRGCSQDFTLGGVEELAFIFNISLTS
jgi:hypothetical protein